MTQPWSSQQPAFAAALLDPQLAAPDFLRTRDAALVAQRFDVYRNNVHASLIDALQAGFPVACRLVGEEFFRIMAREFVRSHLPRTATLHDYGADLPDFIRDFAPAAAVPYLADVAALEHAWWQAYGAADASALTATQLATLDGETLLAQRLPLHPATRVVVSPHPIVAIWAAHQSTGEPETIGDWHAEAALITRPDAEVHVHSITPAMAAFFMALQHGQTVEDAAGAALDTDPAFDPGAALRVALDAGALQELPR